MTTRLLLVRHGQIDANIESRWHGSTDGELTPQGRDEAQRVARHLARARPEVTAVYTSPLKRARDTAVAIADALRVPVVLAPGLAEYSIGVLENETFADLVGRHRFFEQADADLAWAPPGGESLSAVATRVVATWRDVAKQHPGREIALVSHGAAIATGLATLLDGDPRRWPGYRLRNTSVSEIVLEPKPTLLAFDLVDHLA
jgi:2,3-bisphosphoglycerate-dependent phosphoglycerate mutase